jgi:hypothetical protein
LRTPKSGNTFATFSKAERLHSESAPNDCALDGSDLRVSGSRVNRDDQHHIGLVIKVHFVQRVRALLFKI